MSQSLTTTRFLAAALALGALACAARRELHVTSDPPGALVRLDDQVIGRTPLEHRFEHYGHRRLTLYLPGYLAHSQPLWLKTPWYAWFPLDVISDLFIGYRDRTSVHVTLELDTNLKEEPDLTPIIDRALELHSQWERVKAERSARDLARREAAEAAAAAAAAAEAEAEAPDGEQP